MEIFRLQKGDLTLDVTTECGAVLTARFREQDFLRPWGGDADEALNPTSAGSFPMVPFCNRVEGNLFRFEGREYTLESNTDWDPLYLHGEGWISTWQVEEKGGSSLTMSLDHEPEKGAPYGYRACQEFLIEGEVLRIRLSVENTMDHTLIFGTGHHMFFPKTPGTVLKASSEGFWTEKEGFLPDRHIPVPEELDFSTYRTVPGRWVNNGFDRWDGRAEIRWPERNLGLSISGDQSFSDYFIFNSDRDFEPGFQDDYFCFEPMTHSANGHRMDSGYGGLSILKPGEGLHTALEIRPMLLM